MHLEAKVREGPPKVRVVALQAGPGTGAVDVVRQERSRQDRVGAGRVAGVDGVEECARKLVYALRCGPCVEAVETRSSGGGGSGIHPGNSSVSATALWVRTGGAGR